MTTLNIILTAVVTLLTSSNIVSLLMLSQSKKKAEAISLQEEYKADQEQVMTLKKIIDINNTELSNLQSRMDKLQERYDKLEQQYFELKSLLNKR